MSSQFATPEAAARSVQELWKEKARRIAETNEMIEAARRCKKFYTFFPEQGQFRRELYPRHLEFFEAGAHFRERAFIAANRTGKTESGSYEATCHLTGEYPDWWKGKRFERPTIGWAAGDTNTTVRDIIQEKLLGKIVRQPNTPITEAIGIGTGMIPGSLIKSTRARSGVPDAVETIYVKHKSGGVSTLFLKSYEQGRLAFQGTAIDFIWLDEEVPEDIYTECLIRTMTTGGVVYVTFTPLSGLTPVVMKFLPGGKMPRNGTGVVEEGRHVVTATWDDVAHLDEETKRSLWASIPPWQRDARSRGIPQLGSGAIYPTAEIDITITPFKIPDDWIRCYGMDVGWNKTAAIWLAQNPASKQWIGYSEHYATREEPSLQAYAIRARGEVPGVIDPAARGRSQVDGEQLIKTYQDLGLDIIPAKNAITAGLTDVWQLLSAGQLKFFENLNNFFEEYRVYRRDDKGRIVKEKDHLMDAMRYGVMSGRDRAKAIDPPKPTPKVEPYPYGPSTGGSGWMGG